MIGDIIKRLRHRRDTATIGDYMYQVRGPGPNDVGYDAELDGRAAEELERLAKRKAVDDREFCALADMAEQKFGTGWWTAKRDAIRDALKQATDAAFEKAAKEAGDA